MARRYGKEIAVVEPVKGGALMNLPEEAAVLLYQADATAGPASSWSIRLIAGLDGALTVAAGPVSYTHLCLNFITLTGNPFIWYC